MEALARWHHAVRGPVSPAEFIPLAEETGLIYTLGEHLLRTACNQVREWVDAGMNPIPVSVNLSARQVLHADFLAVLDSALRESGLAPQLLELEITESMLIEHQDTVRELLEQIKQRGVKLSIDDFGTGYSSLGYLKNFPIDALKIDRSFIRDVPHEQDDASIVKTIMALAHTLRLEVVAEGVETDVQLDFLKEIGCEVVQGYLFGRPMNPEVFFSAVVEKNRVKA
jgi:EAL domain-containing protein (putative c-di-GMP-specific phosphodiesterase class I)